MEPTNHHPHLCQPDGQKSCVWCCGLYNVQNSPRDALIRKLRLRTEIFGRTDRSVGGIQHFSDRILRAEQSQLIDPDFYSCEFVGFLDTGETRVGCMLHPLARGNGGIDWRGLSFHGVMACQGFFCRAFRKLSSNEKKLILVTIHDWYLYGLVISHAEYVESFFLMTAERLGNSIDPARLLTPPASRLVHEFFRWKIDWPYRNRESGLPSPGGTKLLRTKHLGSTDNSVQTSPAPMDLIIEHLGSEFQSREDRKKAEQRVDRLFSRLMKVISGCETFNSV